MPAMTKRVNINAKVPVRDVKPPIYGTLNNIVMSTGNILKCLCKRAIVDEILPDGSTVRLTMKNYYTDNGAGLTAAPDPTKKKATAKAAKHVKVHKPEPIVEVKEEPVVVEEPTVVEPEPVVVEEVAETSEPDAVVEEPVVVEENAEVVATESEENIKEENVDNAGSQEKDSTETDDESNEGVGQGSKQASSASKKTSRKRK